MKKLLFLLVTIAVVSNSAMCMKNTHKTHEHCIGIPSNTERPRKKRKIQKKRVPAQIWNGPIAGFCEKESRRERRRRNGRRRREEARRRKEEAQKRQAEANLRREAARHRIEVAKHRRKNWLPKYNLFERIPNDLFAEHICSFMGLNNLHSLSLTSKDCKKSADHYYEKVFKCDLGKIGRFVYEAFFHQDFFCIKLKRMFTKDYDETKKNITELIETLKNSPYPLVIEIYDEMGNITLRRVRTLTEGLPNLRELYIPNSDTLKWRESEIKSPNPAPGKGYTGIRSSSPIYRDNLAFLGIQLQSGKLKLKPCPYLKTSP